MKKGQQDIGRIGRVLWIMLKEILLNCINLSTFVFVACGLKNTCIIKS